jgi:hypothetical protein
MYKDEYGNIWASYEDYQNYLEQINIECSNNETLINELLNGFFGNIYIDNKGQIWENKRKYIESGNCNE